MTLICVSDEGNVHVFKDVLAYDCLTKEDFDLMLKIQTEHYKKAWVGFAGFDHEGSRCNCIYEDDEEVV